MQTRSTQPQSLKPTQNRPVKAMSIPQGPGTLNLGASQTKGSVQPQQMDGQVPRRLSENATTTGGQGHAAGRNQQALQNAFNDAGELVQIPGSIAPVIGEGRPGCISRSSVAKSQGRGRASVLRQQITQKSAGGEKTRPMPSSIQNQLDGSNRTEK